MKVLVFRLGSRVFGVNAEIVDVIVEFEPSKITTFPNTPRGVIGVLPIREDLVTVIDPYCESGENIVILRKGSEKIGIVAGEVYSLEDVTKTYRIGVSTSDPDRIDYVDTPTAESVIYADASLFEMLMMKEAK